MKDLFERLRTLDEGCHHVKPCGCKRTVLEAAEALERLTPSFCDACGVKHTPGTNTLCPLYPSHSREGKAASR